MKRIKSACLIQTVHFLLKDDLPHAEAVRAAKHEYEHYKALMDRNHTKYKIVREEEQKDGSLLVEIRKQYNYYDCGAYLN